MASKANGTNRHPTGEANLPTRCARTKGTEMTSYTLNDLIRERNISPKKMEAARNRVDEYIQAYELKEAGKAAHPTPTKHSKIDEQQLANIRGNNTD